MISLVFIFLLERERADKQDSFIFFFPPSTLAVFVELSQTTRSEHPIHSALQRTFLIPPAISSFGDRKIRRIMGRKHNLWRKHSHVRVEKSEPGSIWAVFRIFNYNRWHNVKKMLPYKKLISHEATNNSKVNPDEQYQITDIHELEDYDPKMLNNSASGDSGASKALSRPIEEQEEDNSRKMVFADQQLEDVKLSTLTLLAGLKADPKLDSSKKPKLARSGTYPSPNRLNNLGFGTTPRKVEDKHTEIWPVRNQGLELRREKSERIRRSSSLSEPSDKFGYLFDRTNSRKDMKKFATFSENEFTLLGDLHLHRKSFSDRLSLLETERYCFGSHEAPLLIHEILDCTKIDSPRNSDIPKHTEKSDEDRDSYQEKEEQIAEIEISQDETTLPQVIEEYNEELEYVKHILDVLGFVEREDQYGVWESLDESLDPTLFDELEVLCPFNPNPATKDASERRVLFHLIIEALVDIRENSLSFGLQIHGMSKGKRRVVEEVWKFVSKYLHWRPELHPRLDYAVAQYLSKSISDWKNPQIEIEFAGLDLEELIFDGLLDEIFSS